MVDISDTIEDGYDSYDELFSDYIADRKVTPEKRMEAPLAAGERDNQAQAITHTFWNNHDKDAEELPWAQKYSPVSLNELAVHKKKVADVQSWLSDALCAFEKKLLVLRGPAGSGKTTTLSLLSDKLGFDVLEWRNPSGSEFAAKGFTSTTAQFEEFLTRGNRFRGLEFHGATGSSASKFNSSDHMTPRVILIEEFPTVFDGDSPGLAAFRLSLQRYLSVSSSPRSNIRNDIERHGSSPVVIIVSETMLNTEGSYSDNFTAHKLLGPDILSHPCTTIVDFNAIAPTFMFKALNLVLEKHIRRYRSAKRPGPAMLKSLSEVGDIRSAISSLEFLCLRYSRGRYMAAIGLGMLRQDELSYQVAARGLLFSLPSPVKRRITPTNQKGNTQDGHRILFPTELRLSKEKDQVEELTNSWKTTLLHSLNGLGTQSTKSLAGHYFQAGRQEIVATMAPRNDFLLYQLPYMTRIGFNETVSRELDKITSIPKQRTQWDRQGIDNTFDHEPMTTYRASCVRQHSMPTNSRIYHQHNLPPVVSDREDKFVLSDDDIEDV
ncbi:RFC checkpoint protein Rad17 [Aspergillus fumigatus]